MSDLSSNYFPKKRSRNFKTFQTKFQPFFKSSIKISNNFPIKFPCLQTLFKNFQIFHKQTPKNVFGNFSKLSNNTKHCPQKNTVSKDQNTHPNTYPNFQNIFHFPKNTIQTFRNFPESLSNDFSKLPKRSFPKQKTNFRKNMSKQFLNIFPSFHQHFS